MWSCLSRYEYSVPRSVSNVEVDGYSGYKSSSECSTFVLAREKCFSSVEDREGDLVASVIASVRRLEPVVSIP